MRIVFIANGLGYGGAEKMLSFVAKELYNRGHDVAILNTCAHRDISQLLPDGLKVVEANISSKSSLITYIRRLCFCIRQTRRFHADAIVGFLLFPNLFSVLTGRMLRIPSIISERGDPYLANKGNGMKANFILKLICSASGAVFQTDGAALFYPEKLRSHSIVIPNPISITKKYEKIEYSKRQDIIVSLGRIENTQKRYDVLIDAFDIFHKSHPSYILQIYGGGPDLNMVRNMVKIKGLESSIQFMGVSNNSFGAISKAKIFVITSDYEGISNSLLEAMAVGMPVVSTDHSPGGARFLIQNGKNGLLAPVRDPEKIAIGMGFFADNPEIAMRYGKNAAKVLERFSPQIIIDEWEGYLQKTIVRFDRKNEG